MSFTTTNISNGVTIQVGINSYHSFNDFGLAIGNNDYIGTPEVVTNYVQIPGRDGYLDLTEALINRPTFSSRAINVELGGKLTPENWDAQISLFRNRFHGKTVKLIFDNDPGYYWTGRAVIENFDRFRDLGTFTLSIPTAEPFKYEITPTVYGPYSLTSASPVEVVTFINPTYKKGPYIIVENMSQDGKLKLIATNVEEYITRNGTFYYPGLADTSTHTISFACLAGSCKVRMEITKGSL